MNATPTLTGWWLPVRSAARARAKTGRGKPRRPPRGKKKVPAGPPTASARRWDEGKSRLPPWAAVAAGLASLLAVAHHRVLFFGETFVERDAVRFALPSREFLVRSLRAGRLPEWFDGVGFGAPFAANPVHETLAPLGWLMALLPTPIGFDFYNLLHVLIGGLGVAALARRLGAGAPGSLLAAGSLALGGYVNSMIPNGWAPALAWTPWVAWAADRLGASLDGTAQEERRSDPVVAAAALAAALALQLHAGEPASALIAGMIAWILLLVRRGRALVATRALLLSGLAALLLAAVVLLPGLLLLSTSARGAGLDAGGLEWSLHPARLVELVWPMAYGSQLGDGWYAGLLLQDGPGDPFWSMSLFLGLPVLLSAVAAKERRLRRLLLASLIFLVLAAGPHTPLYALLRPVLPPLGWVNFPEKFVYGALLLWAVVAGVGFTRLMEGGASRLLRSVAFAGAGLLAMAAPAMALWRTALVEHLERRAAEWGMLVQPEAGVTAAVYGGLVAAAGATAFAAALCLRRRSLAGAVGLALIGALGPVIWAAARTTPVAPRAVLGPTPEILQALPAPAPGAPRPRLLRLDPHDPSGPFDSGEEIARDYHQSLDTNVGSRFGLAVLPGFEPGESVPMRRLGREIFPRLDLAPFVRLLGIEWIVAQYPEAQGLPFPVFGRGPTGWALLSPGPVRPRAFFTPRWRAAASPEQALDALALPGRDNDLAMVTVVDPPLGRAPAPGPLVPCGVFTSRPEEVLVDCPAAASGFVVLLDELASGWSATVDGRDARLYLADGLFRAVAVEPGEHRVAFRYQTPGLRAGAAVTLVAWMLLGGLVLWRRRGSIGSPPLPLGPLLTGHRGAKLRGPGGRGRPHPSRDLVNPRAEPHRNRND